MKTFHQIIEQHKRVDAENYRLLSAARWKSMNANTPQVAARYEALRAHYANRSLFIRDRFLSTLHKYGERCRAAGMRWDADIEEYV